ncbi:MAG: hydrogen peroxide-dependent heme synthase, partial [Gaiellales bacterium]|nr:hydrogen peroxide-dependent heme synthase [Gaiellales bacterium]
MTDPLLASEGWGVIHLYFRLLGDRREAIALAEADALVAEFTAAAPYQAIWTAPLGDRADLGLMLIGPDMVRLERLRGALMRSELGRRLEPVPELGLVSLTELSEYTSREGSEEHMAMLE